MNVFLESDYIFVIFNNRWEEYGCERKRGLNCIICSDLSITQLTGMEEGIFVRVRQGKIRHNSLSIERDNIKTSSNLIR